SDPRSPGPDPDPGAGIVRIRAISRAETARILTILGTAGAAGAAGGASLTWRSRPRGERSACGALGPPVPQQQLVPGPQPTGALQRRGHGRHRGGEALGGTRLERRREGEAELVDRPGGQERTEQGWAALGVDPQQAPAAQLLAHP